MSKLVSEAAIREADRCASEDFGFPAAVLMEQASVRFWDGLKAHLGPQSSAGTLLFLAGKGNNGGDAWAMARLAHTEGWPVVVVAVGMPEREPAAAMARIGGALGLRTVLWDSPETPRLLETSTLWLDGLWGAGLREPLRAREREILKYLEGVRQRVSPVVVALDLPSGLFTGATVDDPVLRATRTLAAGYAKEICYHPVWRPFCGIIQVFPLSYPSAPAVSALLLNDEDWPAWLPGLSVDAHKGTRGFVAVVGGSPGLPGAPVLAARSAAAAGAGVVALRTDESLLPVIAPQVPSFLLGPWVPRDPLGRRVDAWVVGPGWGRTPDRVDQLQDLLAEEKPLVIDADGLVAWHGLLARGYQPSSRRLILTPHPGEWARLAGDGAGVEQAITKAEAWGVVIVLKGSVTWVLGPGGQRAVWDGRNPALGTGGSGDCLAGIAGAFLARGLDAWQAACVAVGVHARAGEELSSKGWFLAEELPQAVAQWEMVRHRTEGRL